MSVGLMVMGAARVRADDARSPYLVDWPRDLSVTGIAAAGWIGPQLLRNQIINRSCPCDARDLNPLDRPVAGAKRAAPALASEIAIASVYALSFALDALDVATSHDDFVSWLKDTAVIAQALTINGALNAFAKIGFARPRPLAYDRAASDRALADGENYASFYSEHTSAAFATGLAYAQTFALRHPNSPYRFIVYAAALAAGSAIASLRVLARMHFPSDVLVGAAVGSSVGMTVPWLHARHPTIQLSAVVLPAGAAMSFSFTQW
jgi:membrane-associated phospholipid phosphatase